MIRSSSWTLISAIMLSLAATPAAAQTCTDSAVPGTVIGFTPLPGDLTRPNSCNLLPCYKPEKADGPSVEVDEGCDALSGPCPVRARVALDFPGNSQMPTNTHVRLYWFGQATPPADECLPPPFGSCSPISICGPLGAEILVDKGETWIEPVVSCDDIASGAYEERSFSLSAYACQTSTGECTQRLDVEDIEFPPPEELWEMLECDPPPPPCEECVCNIGGSGGSGGGSAGGGPPGWGPPGTGPKALLRYHGRGAGHPEHPGTPGWAASLGRYWSHDYATRIVLDPDDMNDQHVWLITPGATFVEYQALGGGVYQYVEPSDDYRTLSRTADGWSLRELDGTVHAFNNAGLWQSTTDRNGNAKTATYSGGVLATVSFPDGRSETFAYHPDGKLASITEVGVGGAAQRTWSYTWSGLDLMRIDRPDGIAWTFRYDAFPGYLTRVTLVGTDGGERVEGAWDYDSRGNVVRTWRGDESFTGPGAVEQHIFSYDNPFRPFVTHVTDPLGNVTTYDIRRDPGGVKARYSSIVGTCGTCNLGPTTQMLYDDPQHPLRVSRSIDEAGTVTLMSYDASGRMTSQTEALGSALERTTTWEYHPIFRDLVTEKEQPSTSGSGVRRTTWIRDGAGNATTRSEEGVENGSAFTYDTVTIYNAAGQPESMDPPGYGIQDQTLWSYDPDRGDLIQSSRTDPLVGTTTFAYDSFNRRTSTTDPNGVTTETGYDDFGRVTSRIRKGATAADDLVTTYIYDEFGDLFQVIRPEDNIVELGYDGGGRQISIERRPDATTRGERTYLTLNAAGNRIRQDRQSWNGSGWVTGSFTRFEYSNRCRLDKVIQADGTATEYTYDCSGNVDQIWDPNHPSAGQTNPPTQSYDYDALGRLIRVTQPWAGDGGGSSVTAYDYDVQDHVSRITDPNGTVTRKIHSDRDLLAREISEVRGVTDYTYNEHRRLASIRDARGTTIVRGTDAAGRVQSWDHPDDALDTTYVYDDPAVSFSKARLTAIVRDGSSIEFAYDRFGQIVRDGSLTYGYDKNGRTVTVGYPGDLTATYGYDFVNRLSTLSLERPGAPAIPLVTAASYLPGGPLTELSLGNGLTETRDFDARYFPAGIQVAGHLDWEYTTDAVGNVTAITDRIAAAGSRSFGYQDVDYYLTRADGPWGEQTWAYDRLGNRLSETRDGATEAYSYRANTAGGRSSVLDQVTPASGSATRYLYDPAGNQTTRLQGEKKVRLNYNSERRLTQIRTDSPEGRRSTRLDYDPRGLLQEASSFTFLPEGGEPSVRTTAAYSWQGLLHQRTTRTLPDPTDRRAQPARESEASVVYFDGRPLAIFETRRLTPVGGATTTETSLTYLTTDHLGTPILATGAAGATVWGGGFEPFGQDFSGAEEAGIFLRLPGQWSDPAWQDTGALHYNVARWYSGDTGRYNRPDPLGIRAGLNLFHYGLSNPLGYVDPDGREPGARSAAAGAALGRALARTLDCAIKYGKEARERGREIGWPWAHCWASCQINRECGGEGVAKAFGLAKEVLDVGKCFGEILSFDAIDPDGNCGSAFQDSDFEDNDFGITCPDDQTCDQRCDSLRGKEPPPGPMYLPAVGTQWYLTF